MTVEAAAGTLVMMLCERMDMTLSTKGCGRLHIKAAETPPRAWDPKSACQFCPIGAKNAGGQIAIMAEAVQSLSRHCSRCQKPTARRINGKFCVSCYNRDREASLGRNAKGTRPRLCDQLHTSSIVVATGGTVAIAAIARVRGRVEAMALIARESTEPMAFGIPPLNLEVRA